MKTNLESAIDFIKQHPKLVVAEDYEIVCQKSDSRTNHFKNGELISDSKNSFLWTQIRVLHRKRLGVASTAFFDESALTSMVDRAFDLADHTAVDPWFRFPLWKPEGVSLASKVSEISETASDTTQFFESLYPQLTVCPIGFEERCTEQNDSRLIVRKTEKLIRAFSVRTQKFSFGAVNQGKRSLYGIEETRGFTGPFKAKAPYLEAVLRKASRLSEAAVSNSTPHGKYILNGMIVSNLLKSIELFLNGGLAVLGNSKFSNQIEKRIFSEKVTLIDSGIYPGGEGSQDFDFEGVQSQETLLVNQGLLKTFLHNASTAARYNRVTTGNFVMTDSAGPKIGVTNFYLAPSQKGLLELFEEMGEGFYLESLEKQSKELTRDGKLELLGHGWRVENGEPVEPITHLFLRVDPIEIFKEITAVANDVEFWGRYGAPSVFIENMPLSDV